MEIITLVISFLSGVINLIIRKWVKGSDTKITNMKTTMHKISESVQFIREDIVGMKKDIEYIKRDLDRDYVKNTNGEVRVIRELKQKGKFE